MKNPVKGLALKLYKVAGRRVGVDLAKGNDRCFKYEVDTKGKISNIEELPPPENEAADIIKKLLLIIDFKVGINTYSQGKAKQPDLPDVAEARKFIASIEKEKSKT